MAGIVSYGAYVPWYRLGPDSVGWKARTEKAVANCDEDSITMGVAAVRNCLGNASRNGIGGMYFATTTAPYKEKSNAGVVAVASDLPTDIYTADFSGSLKAGTSALKSAIDAVSNSSDKRKVVVAAADLRIPQPRSGMETAFGDGAAAFIVGDSDVIAEFEGGFAVSHEVLDIWKEEHDQFVRNWEDRFVADEGYLKMVPQAVEGLLKKTGLMMKDFTKVALFAPDARRHKEMVKKLKLEESQVQDPLLATVGNTGAASALMILAAALDEAKAGDRIMVVNYGNGAEALSFKVTSQIEKGPKAKRSVADYLKVKKILPDYETYLTWRGLIDKAAAVRRPPFRTPSPAAMLREVGKNISFHGVKCTNCGYPQFPPQTVCTRCHTKDNHPAYAFADRKATVFTYTTDTLAPTLDPPMVVAVINFERGGRVYSFVTDRDSSEMAIGMEVEMTFRSFNVSDGIHNYFWKCTPVR